ncbi:MAG: heme lyase NrfEFG subunit NrfE, partial [Rhodospirillaceae bacterium]|nr:heme lyase NrfEFG subunit NrfE [Rhodospirillaceae bacterium]
HSFAADPERGVFILLLLGLVVGGSLTLFAVRAPALKAGGLFRPISREGALVVNNLLLVTGCAAVFIGTLYPLILDAISGDKVSVGPPFFESSFVWIMAPLFLLAAAGPLMAWKRADIAGGAQRLTLAFVAAAVAAILLVAIRGGPWGAILGLTIAAWLIGGVAAEFFERVRLFRVPLMDSLRRARVLPRSAWGMSLAHAGIAILIAGAVGATNWQTEHVEVMQVGESAHVAGYDFTLVSLENGQGPNYDRRVGEFRIEQDGELFATLYPEKRKYWVQGSDTTEAAIRTTWLADIYVAIGDPAPGGGLAVRIYHNPLVPWIWLGTLIMVLGGLVSLSDRRHRVGAPNRARQKSAPAQPPQPADNQGST